MTVSVQMPAEVTGPTAPEAGSNPPASSSAPASVTNERPSWLPEKFESPEALAKAYTELEGRFTQQQQAPAVTEEQLSGRLQSQGLDLAKYHAEYTANGKLSDASYAELQQAGVSRQFMDDFIRGQEAIAAQEVAAVYDAVGGEAEYQKIAAWARVNLSKSELEAFNAATESAPVETLKLTLLGLKARYEASNGREPNLLHGVPGGSVEGFASRYEMVQAMSDPRYRKDEAYREQVTARLKVTNFF